MRTGPACNKLNPKKFSTFAICEVEIDKNPDHDKAGEKLREIYQNILISKVKNF